ncbi:hypothetical protein EV200_102585 [Pedobacter psychrotolerans]|uniref:Quercetin 2,3-dioxygenase C-terminal cupin domain-containing protein n=1 Tax=Pedobacter psychrotolerans TaxID=1843235 RepID=A0A4R2HIN7_9SPHI|nr:hypothetical protein [Pedobacter psychrotolerans]TCO29163.1 hypothetical protein EV200_102585 [Pedobacter psychrotolerans]GGE54677.1 hypothetical protein GCM10011413_21280 [Pedobacter psychrotolerans]
MDITSGKIYLADQRGLIETSIAKRHCTFNFEKYYNEHKQASGELFICNDESIAGNKLTFFLSREDSYQLFFPVTGGLDMVQNGKEFSIETGQVQVLNVGKGEVLEISNPYPNDVVNYMQIGITTDLFLLRASEMLFNFDFEKNPNQLIEIISSSKLPFKLSAGIFAGRKETTYHLQNPENRFFCFIIDGAFEIEGRLLHARDGLSLWDVTQVELEALSNNAIILILEHL